MSFCDDCIHKNVCRYIKDIQKFEDKPPAFKSDNEEGPIVTYSVKCASKLVGEIIQP